MKAGSVSSPPTSQHHLVLLDRLAVDAGEALDGNHGVVAVLDGPRIDVAVVGLLVADFFDASGDVFVGDFRVLVGDREVLVIVFQLDLREDFEFGLETQRLAVVEMHVGNIGLADDAQLVLFQLLFEEFGDQVFQHLLPDIAFELSCERYPPALYRGGSRAVWRAAGTS